MLFSCPVCGYPLLGEPPSRHSICPSCGTEFGYDDFSIGHRALRNEWLRAGAHWFSTYTRPPSIFWNGFRQVVEAGLEYDVPEPSINVQFVPIKVGGVLNPKLRLIAS
jgi:hypothetical protein